MHGVFIAFLPGRTCSRAASEEAFGLDTAMSLFEMMGFEVLGGDAVAEQVKRTPVGMNVASARRSQSGPFEGEHPMLYGACSGAANVGLQRGTVRNA